MKAKDSQGRTVEIELYGSDADDIQVASAEYTESDDQVSETEIYWIEREYAAEIYEHWMEDRICAAEDRADLLADR